MENTDELELWRRKVQKDIDDELEEMDEEDRFWELIMFTGPFALMNVCGRQLTKKWGGSRVGRSANLKRKREDGHLKLWEDYFQENPIYGELKFRRRYRMSTRLFKKILDDVCAYDRYFVRKKDAARFWGLSPHQKMTASLRQLAYGVGADSTDEYCRLGESTALESLYRFVKAIRVVYEERYLRKPSKEDFTKQLAINGERGFLGMFGSLDCMHWSWKNCPIAWHGQFKDKDGNKSLILKAIADQELWIWHAFFGLAGGNNDINVLDRSPILNDWL
ncbi:unnamed protein product [Calypogeia fissa]